jgi:hypothetical protein
VTGFSARETDVLDRRSWYLAGFVQDDWNVTRNLTLNIGLRWETDTAMSDTSNRGNSFLTDWNNFGPRFGFAWKPFGSSKSVLRGAYGVAFAHPFDAGVPNAASLGFERSAVLNTPDQGITAPFLLRNGVSVTLQPAELNDSFGAVRVGQQPTTNVTYFESNRRTGYTHMFNFGYQREIAGFLTEITLVGNLSHKLPSGNISLNQVTPERLAAVIPLGRNPVQADRPFPQFTNVVIQNPSFGDSRYYAGVARVERRFQNGYSVLGTYTWPALSTITRTEGLSVPISASAISTTAAPTGDPQATTSAIA